MTTNARSTTIGVFRDRTMAEQAMKALQDAGFGRDQIRYAGRGNTGEPQVAFLRVSRVCLRDKRRRAAMLPTT